MLAPKLGVGLDLELALQRLLLRPEVALQLGWKLEPVAALVLLLTSGNILIALYAVVSIASIVGIVLGFCKWAMDWDLGAAQCIAGVIVIGFSVDYCVHIGHMYMAAKSQTARGRTQYALSTMGSTVLGGAITTFGAGLLLFTCQLNILKTMAVLISLTIVVSLTYALVFFCRVVYPFGPKQQLRQYLPLLPQKIKSLNPIIDRVS